MRSRYANRSPDERARPTRSMPLSAFCPLFGAIAPAAWLPALVLLVAACVPQLRLSDPPERSSTEGLVYVVPDSTYPNRTDIWRARLSDGAVRPLIQTPLRSEERPDWSERASALVVQTRPSWRSFADESAIILWKDGAERELRSEPPAHREILPIWGPLDTRLAFGIRQFQLEGAEAPVRSGIAVLDVETGEQTILARSTHGELYARSAFSPDGRFLVSQYATEGPRTRRIALLAPGSEPQLLTTTEYRSADPSFTRDGRHILFTRWDRPREPRDVMRMRLDGSGQEPFASTPESDEFEAAASPARDEVALISDRDGKNDLFIAPLAGGPAQNLTKLLELQVSRPRWSPDGQQIALTAFPAGTGEEKPESHIRPSEAQVLVVDREGRVLFQAPGFTPDWMPPWE